MNPFELDATGLMVWGLVAHLIADWPLQNAWMAENKMRWVAVRKDRVPHPAAFIHAGIHGVALAPVFGWVAVLLALAHLVIDMRTVVAWWSRLIRQTQPKAPTWATRTGIDPDCGGGVRLTATGCGAPLIDVGSEVRFWTDQVFHIACVAVAALVVAA